MGSEKGCIFVSHSSKDTKLIRLTELTFADREIRPYFAGTRMEGKNPVDKIVEAISDSLGLFALITPNVVTDSHTRDWVVFEFGVAKAKDVVIYVWMDRRVAEEKSYPRLLENITDYDKFDYENEEDCIRVVASVRDLAFKLAGLPKQKNELTSQQFSAGLIRMEEAENIAKQFVLDRKRDYQKMEITSVEPKGDLWIVKGTISRSSPKSYGSELWTVTIKGNEVVACDFRPGFGFAVG